MAAAEVAAVAVSAECEAGEADSVAVVERRRHLDRVERKDTVADTDLLVLVREDWMEERGRKAMQNMRLD